VMTDVFEADLRQALARRAADVPDTTADRLRDARYRPRAHGRPSRLAAVGIAAALAVGVTVAVLPSHGPAAAPAAAPTAAPALANRPLSNSFGATTGGAGEPPVRLLADRAAATALASPVVQPGQWVYRQVMYSRPASAAGQAAGQAVENMWFTAAGAQDYTGTGAPAELQVFPAVSFAQLSSLPADPSALEEYLAKAGWRNEFGLHQQVSPEQGSKDVSAFQQITAMLWLYTMPSKLTAELYQALADVPGVTVDPRATDLAGRPGVAFVLPPADQYPYRQELVLNGSDYRLAGLQEWFVGQVAGETGIRAIPFAQFALLQTAFVARPGDLPATK